MSSAARNSQLSMIPYTSAKVTQRKTITVGSAVVVLKISELNTNGRSEIQKNETEPVGADNVGKPPRLTSTFDVDD